MHEILDGVTRSGGLPEPGWPEFVAARRRYLTDRAFESLVRRMKAADSGAASDVAYAGPDSCEGPCVT